MASRYAWVIAVASAGRYGITLVDGNGDGSELEAGHWLRDEGSWQPGGSAGAGTTSSIPRYGSKIHASAGAAQRIYTMMNARWAAKAAWPATGRSQRGPSYHAARGMARRVCRQEATGHPHDARVPLQDRQRTG